MFKITTLFSLYTYSLGAESDIMPIGGKLDNNGCLSSAGFDWCDAMQSCIRHWETPCSDNYDNCDDCLTKQRSGMNIACPTKCNIILSDIPVINPPISSPPISSPPNVCPEVMCMMYCENGFLTDFNGCDTCVCSIIPMAIDYELPDMPLPNTPGECPIPVTLCTSEHVCPKVVEITHCSRDGVAGYTTYQLSLVIKNPNIKNIYAIYGDDQFGTHPLNIPPAYQGRNIFNSNIGGIPPELIAINPDAEFDSWLTIGLTAGDDNNKLSSVGIDFSSWTDTQGIYTTDGAIFLMNANEIIVSGNEYIIAQLTVPDDYIGDVVINVQGSLSCDKCNTKTWNEIGILFHISKPSILDPNIIPTGCSSWHDGCNTCVVNNGILGGCTRLMCFREDTPHCLSFNNVHNGH